MQSELCLLLLAKQVLLSKITAMKSDNLGNYLRRLCLSGALKNWSLRSAPGKRIKAVGRLVRHSRRSR